MRELDDARYKAIGARIRDVRLQRNMSQAELAEKAFISVPHMSEVENGKTKLRLSTFVYITEALQVSADVLLRTNTPEVNGIYQGEFNDLLADCSPAEIDSIIKIVKELKTTMRDFPKWPNGQGCHSRRSSTLFPNSLLTNHTNLVRRTLLRCEKPDGRVPIPLS